MEITKQIEAYELLESLLSNGHTLATLPITRQRAEGIVEGREQATEDDLRVLRAAEHPAP